MLAGGDRGSVGAGFTESGSMHHRSPDSCLVYIKPTNEDIREIMRGVADEDA